MAKKEVQAKYPNAYCKQGDGEGDSFQIYTQNDNKPVGWGWSAQAAWHDAHRKVINGKREEKRKALAAELKNSREMIGNNIDFRARLHQLALLFDLNAKDKELLKETLILFATTINK
tara:strand:- start:1608 stop:1958 length:351 start_codon:yes stop_codon:yes gene_type:complete